MTFNVSWIFTARNEYSKVAKKIVKSTKDINKSALAAAKSLVKQKNAFKKLRPEVIKANKGLRVLDKNVKVMGIDSAKTAFDISGIGLALQSLTAKAATFKATSGTIFSRMNAAGLRAKSNLEGIQKRFEGITFVSEKLRNAGLALSIGVTLPVALMARSLKNAARDAIETRTKFATVFAGISTEAQSMADNLATGFGLTGTESRKLLGDTADLLTGFGFTQKAALDMSKRVNELSVDLASFQNLQGGTTRASLILTKALLGEAEGAKLLGVAINQTTPQWKALFEVISGGEKLVTEHIEKILETKRAQDFVKQATKGATRMSEIQTKAIIALALATEQSKNAIGDFARTSHELAGQERITASRIQDLKEAFGRILLPVALKLTKAIRSMAVSLTELSPAAKKIILVVAGVAAVAGPLLLLIGGIGLAFPVLAAGAAAAGAALAFLSGPIGLILAAGGALGILLAKSKAVREFFSGIGLGIKEAVGPDVIAMGVLFKGLGDDMALSFGSDSPAAAALEFFKTNFSSLGESARIIGTVIGGVMKSIITGVRVVGEVIGQVAAAINTLDFSKFDIGSILDKARSLSATIGADAIVEKIAGLSLPDIKLPDLGNFAGNARALLGSLSVPTPNNVTPISSAVPTVAPAVATANANATINGQINVSASPGSQIDSIEQESKFNGAQGNLGIGAAG
jgi:hypothetical protein